MKRNRVYFGLLLLGLVVVIVWSMLAMLNAGKEEEKFSVSVIVNDSNNDRWTAMREGLEQAARDNNTKLNYVSTGQIADIEEEMTLLNRELEHGADGIIVQMVDAEVDLESMVSVSSRATVILLETDIAPEEQYTYIGPDNEAIGQAIAEAIRRDWGTDVANKTIGILSGNQKQTAMQQRLTGLKNGLEGSNVNIPWIITEQTQDMFLKLSMKQDSSPVDILIALGNTETELGVDYLLDTGVNRDKEYSLYGVGCSEKAVYYLDKGIIQSLVVPNEFNMGYQSMAAMAKQLGFRLSETENQTVDYLVVDRTTLYDEENQKILFPIVQ